MAEFLTDKRAEYVSAIGSDDAEKEEKIGIYDGILQGLSAQGAVFAQFEASVPGPTGDNTGEGEEVSPDSIEN